jgi:uncharacterized protein (UPF0248 family)
MISKVKLSVEENTKKFYSRYGRSRGDSRNGVDKIWVRCVRRIVMINEKFNSVIYSRRAVGN